VGPIGALPNIGSFKVPISFDTRLETKTPPEGGAPSIRIVDAQPRYVKDRHSRCVSADHDQVGEFTAFSHADRPQLVAGDAVRLNRVSAPEQSPQQPDAKCVLWLFAVAVWAGRYEDNGLSHGAALFLMCASRAYRSISEWPVNDANTGTPPETALALYICDLAPVKEDGAAVPSRCSAAQRESEAVERRLRDGNGVPAARPYWASTLRSLSPLRVSLRVSLRVGEHSPNAAGAADAGNGVPIPARLVSREHSLINCAKLDDVHPSSMGRVASDWRAAHCGKVGRAEKRPEHTLYVAL